MGIKAKCDKCANEKLIALKTAMEELVKNA